MNIKPFILLSVFFQREDLTRMEQIRSLNHDIALLQMERWKLQRELISESKENVMKSLKECYCGFKNTNHALPILL